MNMNNLTSSIEASMEKWAVPGLTIGILDDSVVTTRAFGVQDLETGEPVTPDTMFGIGSISKVFTATLAVRMVDEGRVDLDEPIDALVPAATLPVALRGKGVTLRHLLSHTSGLDGDGFASFGDGDDALQRYIASLSEVRMLFAPGASWSYANIGTCITGYVLATVGDATFESLVRDKVLAPIGLGRTGFGQQSLPDNVATGYDHGPGETPDPHPAGTTWRAANPAGGMISTVENLLRFAMFHLGDGSVGEQQVIGGKALAAMQQPVATLNSIDRWGLGWALRTIGETDVFEHGGWMDGYRAQLTVLPERNAAIAILNNGGYGHTANDEILDVVLADVFGIDKPRYAAISLPQDELQRFVGRYTSSHIDITIRPEDDRLRAFYKTAWHENDGAEITLEPLAADELIIRDGEFEGSRIVLLPLLQDRVAIRFLNRVLYRDQ